MLNDKIYTLITSLLESNNINFDDLTKIYKAHQKERAEIKKAQDEAQAELEAQIKQSQEEAQKLESEATQEGQEDSSPESDEDLGTDEDLDLPPQNTEIIE
jgi:hypothetical protein